MKRWVTIVLSLAFAVCLCLGLSSCGFLGIGMRPGGSSGSESSSSGGNGSGSGSSSSGSGNSSSSGGNNSKPQEDNDGTFIYSGSSIKAASTSISGDIVIPSSHNGMPIDTIPASAFKGCNGITSITVPNSVTSIGSGAFNACSLLRSITLPFVGSQRGNSGVKAAVFGYIFGTSSYQGGSSVRQYYASAGVAYESYYIPSTLRSVTITDETVIAKAAFQDCSMLSEINLNQQIVQVGEKSFNGCSKISRISLPNITILPSSVFQGCISLTNFTINSSVDTIGSYAFSGCSSLSSINSNSTGEFIIPNNVTSIGSSAFQGCSLLRSITLPFVGSQRGNSGVKAAVFGYIFGTTSYQGGSSVRQYYASAGVAYESYYIPSTLRSVTITNETVIAKAAFQNCSMLQSITINKAAQSNVGEKAFENTATPNWV